MRQRIHCDGSSIRFDRCLESLFGYTCSDPPETPGRAYKSMFLLSRVDCISHMMYGKVDGNVHTVFVCLSAPTSRDGRLV